MTALIESLLSLSQITRASLNFRPVDLSALARIAIKDIVHQYPQRNIQFEVEEHLTAHGDANLLRIVLENLLGNAVKFTSRCDPALIHFGLVENDRKKIFYIRDNGAGFDMAYADKLFTPFKRLHAEAEFSGTGIGLSIVQRIITRHGGLIWAEAEIDKGAAFFFTLTES